MNEMSISTGEIKNLRGEIIDLKEEVHHK